MNKKILIFLVMIFALSLAVNAVNLFPTPDSITVNPGENANFVITLSGGQEFRNIVWELTDLVDTSGNKILKSNIDFSEENFKPGNWDGQDASLEQDMIIATSQTQKPGTYTGKIKATFDKYNSEGDLTEADATNETEIKVIIAEIKEISASFVFPEQIPVEFKSLPKNFTITNDGNVDMNIKTKTIVTDERLASISECDETLSPGESCSDIKMRFNVTDIESAGTKTLGYVEIYEGNKLIDNKSITIKIKNMLSINDFELNGDDADDGDDVEIEPGEDITVTVSVESLFDENNDEQEDIVIEKVEANLIIDEFNEDEDEYDETFDITDDLGAGEDEEITITVEVPYKLEGDEFDATIIITGEDENGVEYEEEIDFKINVERDSDELRVYDLKLSPSELTCGTFTRVSFSVINIGDNDQDEAAVRISAPELGFERTEGPFEMKERASSSSNDQEFSFTIYTTDKSEGVYPITVDAMVDEDVVVDSRTIELTIGPCGTSDDDNNDDNDDANYDDDKDDNEYFDTHYTTEPTSGSSTSGTTYDAGRVVLRDTSKGFFDSTEYMVILSIAVLIVLAGVVGLLLKL